MSSRLVSCWRGWGDWDLLRVHRGAAANNLCQCRHHQSKSLKGNFLFHLPKQEGCDSLHKSTTNFLTLMLPNHNPVIELHIHATTINHEDALHSVTSYLALLCTSHCCSPLLTAAQPHKLMTPGYRLMLPLPNVDCSSVENAA